MLFLGIRAVLCLDLNMEEVLRRFPVIGSKILNHVGDESLIDFKATSRENYDFLENEKIYWLRIIKKYIGKFNGELD